MRPRLTDDSLHVWSNLWYDQIIVTETPIKIVIAQDIPLCAATILLMTFTLLHLLGVAVKGHFRHQQQQFWAIINIKSGPREQTKTSWNGQLSALLNTPAKYRNNRAWPWFCFGLGLEQTLGHGTPGHPVEWGLALMSGHYYLLQELSGFYDLIFITFILLWIQEVV